MTYEDYIKSKLYLIKCPFCGKLVETDNPNIFFGCNKCLQENKDFKD